MLPRLELGSRRMRLLLALARRPGQLVLADELLRTVWKGVIVTPNSLYQGIAQLRRQLGDHADEPRYIATVPRKGYRLVAPVLGASEEPAQAAAIATPAADGVGSRTRAAPVAAAGWRRFWGLPFDPALAGIAATSEVAALVASVRPDLERQRARVEREVG